MVILDFSELFNKSCDILNIEVSYNLKEHIIISYLNGNSYHNLDHINYCLSKFIKYAEFINDKLTVFYSILFHDIVYDPKNNNNEEQSVINFINFFLLKNININIDKVSNYIMSTVDHKRSTDDDLNIFLDIDMMILSENYDIFLKYCESIRSEYNHIKDSDFNFARLKFLNKCRHSVIFNSDIFEHLNEKAYKNIDSYTKSVY